MTGRRTIPLLTWPVGDAAKRRQTAAVVPRAGLVELVFATGRGGITPVAVYPCEAFRLWAAICGHDATIRDATGRASLSGRCITRDAQSNRLLITELRVTPRYASRARDILLDEHARACLRAQIARAMLAASVPPMPPVRLPLPVSGVAGAYDAAQDQAMPPVRLPLPVSGVAGAYDAAQDQAMPPVRLPLPRHPLPPGAPR